MKGVQYVVDDRGAKRAVVIDLRTHAELWEDFCDRALAESRRSEPRETLQAVKARIGGRGGSTDEKEPVPIWLG